MEEWSDIFFFQEQGEQQHGEISFLTNLSEGSLNRLDEGYDSQKTFDPRFAVLLSSCLVGDSRSDQRQSLSVKISRL